MKILIIIMLIPTLSFGEVGQSNYYKKIQNQPKKAVDHLSGVTLINSPITVKGNGRVTLINNVKAINTKKIYSKNNSFMINVVCPRKGHKIIINNVNLINKGDIVSFSKGVTTVVSSGMLTATCNTTGNKEIILSNSKFVNDGNIKVIN